MSKNFHLYENGWVIIPQVVPRALVTAAILAINSTVEGYLDSIQVRASELREDDRLKSLLMDTDAFSLIESALGQGKVVPSHNIQAALRFPEVETKSRSVSPHIDGFHPSIDGQKGIIRPFIAIAGFFLNDLDEEWAGNFTVWPGTHRSFEKYFQTHQADPELRGGIPPVALPEPVQLKVKAGDMVLAHYQLAHTASANLSDDVRYAVYIRMHHTDRPKDSIDVLGDIWRYWDGMADLVHSNKI